MRTLEYFMSKFYRDLLCVQGRLSIHLGPIVANIRSADHSLGLPIRATISWVRVGLSLEYGESATIMSACVVG